MVYIPCTMCCHLLQAHHGVNHLSTTMSFASPLDETLDREVLLLMQGPSPEHMSLEFKNLLCKLVTECDYVCVLVCVFVTVRNAVLSLLVARMLITLYPSQTLKMRDF